MCKINDFDIEKDLDAAFEQQSTSEVSDSENDSPKLVTKFDEDN